MANSGPDAVITRIASANDNDVLALSADIFTVLKLCIKERLRVHLNTDIMNVYSNCDGSVTNL